MSNYKILIFISALIASFFITTVFVTAAGTQETAFKDVQAAIISDARVVQVVGELTNCPDTDISLRVFDPTGNMEYVGFAKTDSNMRFNISFSLTKPELYGVYTVVTGYADLSATVTFTNNDISGYQFAANVDTSALTPGQYFDRVINVQNKGYEGKQVLVIAAVFSPNGRMVCHAGVSQRIEAGETQKFTPGFNFPNDIAGLYVKVFVWEGLSVTTSNMINLAEYIEIK